MAAVTIRAAGGHASVSPADVRALQAAAVVEVNGLAGNAAALAACALVTAPLAVECLISMTSTLTRNQAMADLRAATAAVQDAPVWPPT